MEARTGVPTSGRTRDSAPGAAAKGVAVPSVTSAATRKLLKKTPIPRDVLEEASR